MRLLGIFLTACVVLAAAQAVAVAFMVLLLLATIYGLISYPRETFGMASLCILAGLIQAHPLACLGFAALLVIAGMIRQRIT